MAPRGRRPKPSLEEHLKKEAELFSQEKIGPIQTEKPLTPRQHLAGLVLTGLLARSQGLVSMGDLRREAYSWADYLLEIE